MELLTESYKEFIASKFDKSDIELCELLHTQIAGNYMYCSCDMGTSGSTITIPRYEDSIRLLEKIRSCLDYNTFRIISYPQGNSFFEFCASSEGDRFRQMIHELNSHDFSELLKSLESGKNYAEQCVSEYIDYYKQQLKNCRDFIVEAYKSAKEKNFKSLKDFALELSLNLLPVIFDELGKIEKVAAIFIILLVKHGLQYFDFE